jgi:hypothetical protein
MIFVRKSLPLLLGLVASITAWSPAAHAVDRDKTKFTPPELDNLQTKQTISDVTIGAVPFEGDSEAASAFGKMNPYEHGVLPVLVVIRNGSKNTIRLQSMKVEYRDKDRESVDPIPPAEVPFLEPPRRPTFGGPTIPGLGRKKKNPLAGPEIEIRAFSAKMLPPGESAHGFFYFRTGHRSGSTLYISGLQEASTGKDLFFYEIPLE